MLSKIRQSDLFRRVRRTRIVHEVVRPAYSRALLRDWWRAGRPSPPPHDVKLWSILYLADRIGARALVETGSYLGDTIRALQDRFELYASIEIAPALAAPLIEEFADDPSIRIIVGDSGVEMRKLLPEIGKPTVFWLDAHYSGGATRGDGYVPIFAELESIRELAHPQHAVLIDDMKDFVGKDGYPTQEALTRKMVDMGYEVACFDNMLHAVATNGRGQAA